MVLDPAGQGTATQVQDGVRMAARFLEQAGYAVEELDPPSIDAAAKALVIMYATPGIRTVWQQVMAPSMPTAIRRFMSAFFEAAGDPDPLAAEQAFIMRQALLRSWSEFQEHHPLIVAPIATDIPRKAEFGWTLGFVLDDPGPALVKRSEEAAMLVVGTHEHVGHARLVSGSVSRYCLSHAKCPTVIVPSTIAQSRQPSDRRQGCGTEGGASSPCMRRRSSSPKSLETDATDPWECCGTWRSCGHRRSGSVGMAVTLSPGTIGNLPRHGPDRRKVRVRRRPALPDRSGPGGSSR
jgi:hypothetical protein